MSKAPSTSNDEVSDCNFGLLWPSRQEALATPMSLLRLGGGPYWLDRCPFWHWRERQVAPPPLLGPFNWHRGLQRSTGVTWIGCGWAMWVFTPPASTLTAFLHKALCVSGDGMRRSMAPVGALGHPLFVGRRK